MAEETEQAESRINKPHPAPPPPLNTEILTDTYPCWVQVNDDEKLERFVCV